MTVEISLFTRLKGFAPLARLIGGGADPAESRIYPVIMPQGAAFPAVVYQRVSAMQESALDSDANLVQYRHQIDAWAKSYDEAHRVAQQVRAAVLRYSDGGFSDIHVDTMVDDYDVEGDAYRVILDIRPWASAALLPPTYDGFLSDYTVNRGTPGTGTFTINNVDSHFADPDGVASLLTFSVTGDNDAVAEVSVAGGSVVLRHKTTGVVTVTLTATNPNGLSVSGAFAVTFTGAA